MVLIALRESLKLLVAVTLVDLCCCVILVILVIIIIIIIIIPITPFRSPNSYPTVTLQLYGSAGPQGMRGVLYVFAFIYYIQRIMYIIYNV
jgi:hypothetical protein